MVDNLRTVTSTGEKRATVVIDAGIATSENLATLKEKGYNYVCVSRSNLKKYNAVSTAPVRVTDNRGRAIELREALVENGDSEYYLKVESPQKALKERAMSNVYIQRVEEGLIKIEKSIHKKGGVKEYGKVNERIGRLKGKYPAASKMFSIKIEKEEEKEEKDKKIKKSKRGKNDKKGNRVNCKSIQWNLIPEAVVEDREEQGVYFLKTSLPKSDNNAGQEALIWTIYNCIRNIESSFRTLKTDLDLRPVYHQTDQACEAHLHLGLLAYWLVNTVRYKLKKHNIHSQWSEIIRIMNTQKVVTTCVENDKKQIIRIRKCSEPADKVKLIYYALDYKSAPFIRKKSVVNKYEFSKNGNLDLVDFSSA